MDLAGDLSSQSKLKAKKMQEATKHQANEVVNDVMQQVALKRRVDPTSEQVVAQNAAAVAANQLNYNNIRKSILNKIAEHKMKVQQDTQVAAAKVAQKVEVTQLRHAKYLSEEKQRFEQRKAKNNAVIADSIKSGIY